MILTTRGLLLFFLAGVLMLLFSSAVTAIWGFVLFNGFWLFFVAWDYFLTPGSAKLIIKRNMAEKLSIGADNRIEITAENRSLYSLHIYFRDDCPFGAEEETLEMQLEAGKEGLVSYTAVPRKRGDYQFGYVWVRVKGLLGLIMKQFKVAQERTVEVYPNIVQVGNYDLLAMRGRLPETGLKPSKVYGSGMEFESLREYSADDDFRKINWKATARKGIPIVENYDVDRAQNLMIVIDVGRMMMGEVENLARVDYAINAAVLLSYVALKRDDRVGVLTFSREVKRFIPPGRGKTQLHQILQAFKNTEASMEEPDFTGVIKFFSKKARKRSLVVIFTDLLEGDAADEMVKGFRSFYPVHLPLCVLINDPLLQSEANTCPEDSRSLYRKAVAQDTLWQRYTAITSLRRSGVIVMDVHPEKLASALVKKYLEVKLRGRL